MRVVAAIARRSACAIRASASQPKTSAASSSVSTRSTAPVRRTAPGWGWRSSSTRCRRIRGRSRCKASQARAAISACCSPTPERCIPVSASTTARPWRRGRGTALHPTGARHESSSDPSTTQGPRSGRAISPDSVADVGHWFTAHVTHALHLCRHQVLEHIAFDVAQPGYPQRLFDLLDRRATVEREGGHHLLAVLALDGAHVIVALVAIVIRGARLARSAPLPIDYDDAPTRTD